MKRILVSVTYYYPNISGVTIYAKLLAEELAKRKKQVTVLTSAYDKKSKTEETIEGVKIKRSKVIFRLGKGVIMPMFWRDSFLAVKEADVVNCHLPEIESVWLAVWAKVLKKKLIVTHHCEFGFDGPISNKLIAVISYPFHLITYLLADKIVAYTQDYANHSMFLRLFKNKLEIILPPIKVKSTPNPSFDKEGKFNNHKIVGFVGRIAWEKGLDVLVEAMKQVKAKLVLVGPYNNIAGGDKTIEKLKLNKNIVLYGPIKHEDLGAFYQICDCLVLPSTSNLETFGIVQAEAMVCGCPVVASNLPGVRVPVNLTGMGMIAKVGDSQDLAEKITAVLIHGKKYYQDRAKNLDLFDYKKTADEYEKMF